MNVDEDTARARSTDAVFERGQNYRREGRIQQLDRFDDLVTATVRGSKLYDVTIEFGGRSLDTNCTCPYDGSGDCKHIVAVLLAIDKGDAETTSDVEDADGAVSEAVDIEALVEQTAAADLRTFLLEVIEDDRDIRDRFVAFMGEDTGKTVYDYKQKINRLFEDAAGRRGMVEYDTYIDFSEYHDLAETHRERGHIDSATDMYRAIAETIRENLNRVDDSGGHYGRELERAIELYAETVVEQDLVHEQKRPYIEYLCEEFIEADYGFASDYYYDALRTLCTTTDDLEYWLEVLDSRVSGVALDTVMSEERSRSEHESATDDTSERHCGREEDILYVSDFTDGPLTTDDFTGGILDVEHLGVGTLKLEYFVGDAFKELCVDEPTTIKEHTVDVELTGSRADEAEILSSLQTRRVISTYIYLLKELGEEEALSALHEEVYLESARFCKEYAERLRDDRDEERAIEVIEDGIHTFGSTRGLRWLAVDFYEGRNPDRYRDTLKILFLDNTEWAAIELYIHDGDLKKAFAELKNSDDLSLLKRYREPVASVAPVEYFERYRELLVPFAAGETGRRHYREIADHLEEMQGLVPEERFAEFVGFLKDEHSNRPAFLDELEKAGF